MKKIFALLTSFILLTSCASTMSGNSQNITVTSNVQGATCTLSNDKGTWTLTTPGSAVITSSRVNLALTCAKEGYLNGVASLPSKHKDSATWGNVILGGGIGYIIDRKSGAAFIYPQQVTVDLTKK
jgi:hypothetical protein|tara:strand:- start:64 stop:441 length:378 start_codon:yes stop_codon:yes gene_type:complete